MQTVQDSSLGVGVLFASHDCVGAARRIGVLLIDGAVLLLCWWLLAGIILYTELLSVHGALIGFWAFVWLYLAGFKSWNLRTPGYWFMDCRVVDLTGRPPALWRATLRALLWLFFAGVTLPLELAWCGVDRDRRSWRDCWSGTMVVRARAIATATGPVHLRLVCLLMYPVFYPSVSSMQRSAALVTSPTLASGAR